MSQNETTEDRSASVDTRMPPDIPWQELLCVILKSGGNHLLNIKPDFFPNDKKNSARRMLIEKFEQFGGTWIQQWHPSIHIVVVENHLTYQDLLKYTKIDNIPVS